MPPYAPVQLLTPRPLARDVEAPCRQGAGLPPQQREGASQEALTLPYTAALVADGVGLAGATATVRRRVRVALVLAPAYRNAKERSRSEVVRPPKPKRGPVPPLHQRGARQCKGP